MKILNLYSGLGGNRAKWGDTHEITSVEKDFFIMEYYHDHYPKDRCVIGDAREWLVKYYREFDFIWSSPPCQSHSKMRFLFSKKGRYEPVMPDMSLWSEIIFLQNFFDGYWVVENVRPYYKPLIEPTQKLGRHYFWSNFEIPFKEFNDGLKINEHKKYLDLTGYTFPDQRKDQLHRNCTKPEIGEHILNNVNNDR